MNQNSITHTHYYEQIQVLHSVHESEAHFWKEVISLQIYPQIYEEFMNEAHPL